MGLLRVLLALAVALQHCGGGIDGYAMVGGSLAVQGFFVVSGFYMGLVLNERYDRPALNRAFYANRLLRVFGTYWFFLGAYAACYLALWRLAGVTPLGFYTTDVLPFWQKAGLGLLNLTVIGQELPGFLRIEHSQLAWSWAHHAGDAVEVPHFMLIRPAWTLSLELCFYLLAPFICRRPTWQVAALALASLAARVAWYVHTGIDEDPVSYRFFPFELAFFLAGVLAWRAYAQAPAFWQGLRARPLALAAFAGVLGFPWLLGAHSYTAFFVPGRLLVLALIITGLPAIHGWTGRNRADRALGELSYPLYLGHSMVIALTGAALGTTSTKLSALALSLLVAWAASRLVEAPIERVRRALATRAGARGFAGEPLPA